MVTSSIRIRTGLQQDLCTLEVPAGAGRDERNHLCVEIVSFIYICSSGYGQTENIRISLVSCNVENGFEVVRYTFHVGSCLKELAEQFGVAKLGGRHEHSFPG